MDIFFFYCHFAISCLLVKLKVRSIVHIRFWASTNIALQHAYILYVSCFDFSCPSKLDKLYETGTGKALLGNVLDNLLGLRILFFAMLPKVKK